MNVSSIFLGVITWGIPILEVAICFLAGRFLYRFVRFGERGWLVISITYLVATSIPVLLGISIIVLGSYLGLNYRIYTFFGENVWGLGVLTGLSFLIALVSNIVFWFALLTGTRKSNDRKGA